MLKKISLPVLLTVMCALLLVVVLLYGFNTGKFTFLQKKAGNQTAILTKEEEKIKRTDYTEVARKTLDWIDKQRNEEGWYILERGCDYEKKTCDTVWDNKEGNKDGLIATWARLNFYEQHKDPKDLEIVKKDIDIFYDKYKDDNLKDSLWICKITYEMAQSKYLDQGQKDKLKELCFNIEIPNIEKVMGYWNKDRTNMVLDVPKDNRVWNTWSDYSLVMRSFDSSLAYPIEWLYQYYWSKDDNFLSQASLYLEKYNRLVDENKIIGIDNFCLIGLSNLEMYVFAKDKSNLDKTISIYNKYTRGDGIDIRAVRTQLCGLMARKLKEVSLNSEFMNELENNNKTLIRLGLDGEVTNVENNGSFFTLFGGEIPVLYKSVTNNGLMVELIRY